MIMWVNCLLLLTVACIQQHRGTKILLESMDEHLDYLDYFYWGLLLSKILPMEKETATHSSTLAWKIPWMEEPSRLQSMGSQRVRHDWVTSLTHSRLST